MKIEDAMKIVDGQSKMLADMRKRMDKQPVRNDSPSNNIEAVKRRKQK